jgi:hypothetical protein
VAIVSTGTLIGVGREIGLRPLIIRNGTHKFENVLINGFVMQGPRKIREKTAPLVEIVYATKQGLKKDSSIRTTVQIFKKADLMHS